MEYLAKWRLARVDDRMIEDKPPIPVIIVGANDGADAAPTIVNAAGEITEASASTIDGNISSIYFRHAAGLVLMHSSDGVLVGGTVSPWMPFVPVTVTADGAGLPPATVIIPLVAALRLDVMVWMQVDTVAGVNQYQFDFRTDPLAAVGGITATIPAWAAVELPLPANGSTPPNTYGHRIMTNIAASAFGIAEGANADWPNAAQVTFFGFVRTVA